MWQQVTEGVDRQLFVALKVAEVCNLACGYCYFFEHADRSYQEAPPYLSRENAKATADFLFRGAVELGIPRVTVALHGGEPLVIGKKRLGAICETLIDAFDPQVELVLGIQTNGVLLDPEWISLLANYNCSIGISLDGERQIHDRARPDKRGRPTYDRVVRGLRMLQQAEADGVIPSFGVLGVLSHDVSAQSAYVHLAEELGCSDFHLRAPTFGWDGAETSSISGVERAMVDLFESWVTSDDPTIAVRSNIEALHPMIHDQGALARVSNILDLFCAISIRTDGDVCPDDSLPPIAARFREAKTNVHSGSLAAYYNTAVWAEFAEAFALNGSACDTCNWFGVCGGGPLATRYSQDASFRRASVYCSGFKGLYGRAQRYASAQLGDQAVGRRLQMASRVLREHAARLTNVP